MDFGSILDQWENTPKNKKKDHPLEKHLDTYLPDSRVINEKESGNDHEAPGQKRAARLAMKPQKTLDLHRLQLKEASEAVDKFFRECKKNGIVKVLIIHGKGKHSKEPFVLARKIREYIRKHPLAGECGSADRDMGGSGAFWVILR